MIAMRYVGHTTDHAIGALLHYLSDPACERVSFFAGPLSGQASEDEKSDVNEQNMPLLAATVDYKIPHASAVVVVLDGDLLSAARGHRAREISRVLDAAMGSGKAFVCLERATSTHRLDSPDAVKVYAGLPRVPLDGISRVKFFSLLSTFTELELAKL